jgi:phenylalanyl-tRNA synthetase beta chain
MAGIKFSKKEFEKQIKLTKEIEEKISMMGTHLESVNENEIEIEVTPNRPDLYTLQGLMRALKSFTGKETGLKEYKLNKPEKNFEVKIDSSVKEVRPYTACAIVKDIKFDDEKIKEIIAIQEKLHMTLGRNRKKIAIGIYPLEKITLPIRFEARKPQDIKFQPLEFERELNGLQILQSHPTGREYAHLLEGKTKFPIFIDAKDEILSMPPIINSHKTGKITETTKDIFIECSGFDFEILKKTINILVTMLADMGGNIYQMNLLYGSKKETTPDLTPEKIKISLENTNKLLGLELKESEMSKLLQRMGYNYDKGEAEVPAWRTDIMHEVDLIEDIAIAYGYDNFKPEIPQISTTGEIDRIEIMKKKICDILTGLSILEVSSYHLLTKDDQKRIEAKEAIEVEDSKSEYKVLRPNLIGNSMKILSENIDVSYPHRIFELGRVFNADKEASDTGIKEQERLCISICDSSAGFTEMKQILDYLARMLEKDYTLEPAAGNYFTDGRCAKIIINKKEIGFIGEINPKFLSSFKIKNPIAALELNIEELF